MLLRLVLSAIPFRGLVGGAAFVNRVEPFVFGLPLLLAWIVLWVLLTVALLALVYRLDPANRDDAQDEAEPPR